MAWRMNTEPMSNVFVSSCKICVFQIVKYICFKCDFAKDQNGSDQLARCCFVDATRLS